MLFIRAIVGRSVRKLSTYSHASVMNISCAPSLTPPFRKSTKPPICTVASGPPCSQMSASMLVMVVLPWQPAMPTTLS